MKDRTEFNEKAEMILDFVDTYGVLKYGHLEKFFPGDKKVVDYLIKNMRLSISTDKAYISTGDEPRPDKALTAALGMLGDIFGKVKTHTRAVPPVQISFITHNNDYYEIIYVGYGMEALVESSVKARIAAEKRDATHVNTAKRMIIVEDEGQMDRLQIPGIKRFALVRPDGSLTYYKGS